MASSWGDRLWSKIDTGSADDCWPWLGATTSAGYGRFNWFRFEGHIWHAVQYGEWTQIAHCRRTKEKAA
jgi:hypothetical protein